MKRMNFEKPLEVADYQYCCAPRDHTEVGKGEMAIYLRSKISAVPIEIFGTSDEVELFARKVGQLLAAHCTYQQHCALPSLLIN